MVMFGIADVADGVLAFARDHAGYTLTIVFILGFAEGIALVSLFVPSTVLFLALGGIHSAAGGTFWQIWLMGAAGAIAGDIVSYLVGSYFKADVHRLWPFTRMPGLLPKCHAFVERWGFWSILGGKFIGGLRPFVPVVAGMLDMPLIKFLVGSAVSSLAWAGVFLAPGFGVGLVAR